MNLRESALSIDGKRMSSAGFVPSDMLANVVKRPDTLLQLLFSRQIQTVVFLEDPISG